MKWSYYAPALQVYHEAHVENVTPGTYDIKVANQPGCTVGTVTSGGFSGFGPQTVAVKVSSTSKAFTLRVDVDCL